MIKRIAILTVALVCAVAGAQVYLDQLNVDNVRIDANTISTTNTNGHLVISPNGSGLLEYTPGTASTVPYLSADKRLVSSAVTPTELGYLSGVTSAIQTQMGLKAPLANPTFTGTVTGTFSGNLTGDVTGNVSGSSGSTTGNAATATALAANPSDCAADTYATTIAASGNLTCATVTNAGLAGSIAASKLIGTDIATVGTITSGTWTGTTIAIANGGTGATSKANAFDALSPMSASGDIIYGGASGTGTRLAKGSDGEVLTLSSGVPTWDTPAAASNVSSGSQRTEWALLECDSSAAITDQSGTWVSSIGNVSSGHCAVTISGFSTTPACVITADFHDAANIYFLEADVSSSTAVTIGCHFTNTGSATGNCSFFTVSLLCMGDD